MSVKQYDIPLLKIEIITTRIMVTVIIDNQANIAHFRIALAIMCQNYSPNMSYLVNLSTVYRFYLVQDLHFDWQQLFS